MNEVFEQLESHDRQIQETIKQKIREQFSKYNESWLVNGFYEYYLNTNSVRSMEILVTLKEPHHNHLFDRLCESIRGSRIEIKVQALTLLGHVARSQTTWLYKLPDHILFRELLRLLNNETELLPLISALLVLIVLLPILPSAMGVYLPDIFDIFSRLASMNCQSKTMEDQLIHMQVALYALFLRLYGMYPCNFLTYLRIHYKDSRNPIFVHTIKPMLDTVRMHSSLVTSSKESEKTTERWRRMGVHDVIIECERFSLDMTDRCPHDTCQNMSGFRSRSGTSNSTIETPFQVQSLRNLTSLPLQTVESTFYSPSTLFQMQSSALNESPSILHSHLQSSNYSKQEDSPPEAAIEATPETTPIRDFRSTPVRVQSINTNVVRALTSFNRPASSLTSSNRSSATPTLTSSNRNPLSVSATPTQSLPSSPMRTKDMSPFNFPTIEGTAIGKGVSAFARPKSEALASQKVSKLMQERSQAIDIAENMAKPKPPPSSPLRIINPDMRLTSHALLRNDSPVSQEDEEVLSIVSRNQNVVQPSRPCDSILPEFEDAPTNEDEQEQGSPCTAGGMHMPNSKSMNNFARTLRRLRHHSQCNPEPERNESSTGSSPGNGVHFASDTVRRANSCPEMEKAPSQQPFKDNKSKPFYETDEETVSEDQTECISNTSNGFDESKKPKIVTSNADTQTDNFWPMPYEHLFLGIFPSLECNDAIRPSPIPSPASLNIIQEKYQPSIYDILDKYVESAVNSSEGMQIQVLKNQLELLHQQLLFERHRRETHAYRNRRLLSDAKSTRLLEECNSALRDRVQLQERDILDLKDQLNFLRIDKQEEGNKLYNTVQHWETQCLALQKDLAELRESNEILERELNEAKRKCVDLDVERQQDKAGLIDALAECNVLKEQAHAGEQGRNELEQVNKEILLIGELHLRYKEKLEKLSSARECDEELKQVKEAYREEVKGLHHQIDGKTVSLEACRFRIIELERAISSKEEIISEQKCLLNDLKERHHEVLKAVESKYENQLALNLVLEERVTDLHQKLELESSKRNVHSPDTSSCHEVHVTTGGATGLSPPHSSPLSTSLASSEGGSVHPSEARNVQAILENSGESNSDEGQLGSSSTYKG